MEKSLNLITLILYNTKINQNLVWEITRKLKICSKIFKFMSKTQMYLVGFYSFIHLLAEGIILQLNHFLSFNRLFSEGAGEGLFAKENIKQKQIVCFFNGTRQVRV